MAEPASQGQSQSQSQSQGQSHQDKSKPKTNPLMHDVVPGDTLPELAKHYYGNGDEKHWRYILEANKQAIDKMQQEEKEETQQAQQAPSAGPPPPSLKPGEKLTIPALTAEEANE